MGPADFIPRSSVSLPTALGGTQAIDSRVLFKHIPLEVVSADRYGLERTVGRQVPVGPFLGYCSDKKRSHTILPTIIPIFTVHFIHIWMIRGS